MENQVPKLNSAHRLTLLEQVREVAGASGVYLMKDLQGGVLYVGKAKNLKNRLLSYFQAENHPQPRIQLLVMRIHRFDVILTETESEALILEATLIKKYRPKFNIRLKDDKAYPYLKIQMKDPFPRIEWARRVLKDDARYFGPFPSAGAARAILQLLTETFQLRDCTDMVFLHRSRPCILFQMKKCSGPCVGQVSSEEYQAFVAKVVGVLEGQSKELVRGIQQKMEIAAQEEEFEVAARYRDQMQQLELMTQTQGVFEAGSQRNRDIIGIARHAAVGMNPSITSEGLKSSGVKAHGTLLRVREGKLIAVQHYDLQNLDESCSESEVVTQFLTQYYYEHKGGEGAPTEVLVPTLPVDLELLEQSLGLGICESKSSVDQQLLQVAHRNALYALEQSRDQGSEHSFQALEEVQKKLHLPQFPRRIECYDISNLQGEDAVASRVVFIDGNPDKNLYRRYKIKTVQGANDFAMMKEVLSRRFEKSLEDLPDLIVVDGGKGQLAQAVAVLEELSVQGVSVAGLAKARVEADFQASEVKASMERIFIPNRKNPIPLLPHTQAYRLLVHVRNEAHRFAVSYHRVLRKKRILSPSQRGK